MWIKVNPTTSLVEAVSCSQIAGMTDEVDSVPDDLINQNQLGIQQYYYIYNEFVKKTDEVIAEEELQCEDNAREETRFFYAFEKPDSYGLYACYSVGMGTKVGTFPIPCDFDHFHCLSLVCIPTITGSGKNIQLTSSYAGVGEAKDTHEEEELALTYDVEADVITHIDISPVFNYVSAGDMCGLVVGNYTGSPLKLLGIRMVYHKT